MNAFAVSVFFAMCSTHAVSPVLAEPGLHDDLSKTLDAMTAAGLAGDAEAYLENIATDEPEFYYEQVAWAKDIKRITPFVLAYDMVSEPEVGDDGEATVDLAILWNTPNWEGRNRSIEIPARFVWDNESESWDFGGRDWEVRETEGLRVMHRKGSSSVARRVVSMWPDIKEHVEAGFETTLDHPQVVKLYPTMQELQFSIFPAYAEPLGGWNEPGESMKLLGRESSPEALRTVLAHEYGHALTFAMGGPDIAVAVERAHAMPWWLLEGTAEIAASKFSRNYSRAKRAVAEWYKNDELPEWSEITNFYETDPEDYRYVYTQGMHFAAFVSERVGRTGRNNWLRLMMQGQTLEEATLEIFGVSFEQLDAEWKASIEAELSVGAD